MSLNRRIVVTGLGAVSALGHTVESNWQAARDGVCAIKPTRFDAGPRSPGAFTLPAAMVAPGYTAALEARMGRKITGMLDPFALLQLAAAFEALNQAGLIGAPSLDQRTAIVVGQGMAGMDTLEKAFERFYGQKNERMHPATVPKIMVSAPASAVAMQFGIHGPVFATSSACASSAHAIIQGAALIQAGLADVAVVGGSEAVATPATMRGWVAIQALAEICCRPFSIDRDGMTIAEGGAALVLETLEHAEKRGAKPLGEYLGGGMSSDAGHITQPSLEGPVAAMRQAAKTAELDKVKSVLVSAHGTGTQLNDKNETNALREVFREDLGRHAVIATKSAHGHLIGGTAALQAVIALRALAERVAPPILNFLGKDPECDLNLVTAQCRDIEADHLLLNAFAFGGLNASLVFRAWH